MKVNTLKEEKKLDITKSNKERKVKKYGVRF